MQELSTEMLKAYDDYEELPESFYENYSYGVETNIGTSQDWLLFSLGALMTIKGKLVWTHKMYDKEMVSAPPLETFEQIERAVSDYGTYAIDAILNFSRLATMNTTEGPVWPVKYDFMNDFRHHSLFTYVSLGQGQTVFSPYFKAVLLNREVDEINLAYTFYAKKFVFYREKHVDLVRKYLGDRSYHMDSKDPSYAILSKLVMVYDVDSSNAFTPLGTGMMKPGMPVYLSSKPTNYASATVTINGVTMAFYDQRKQVVNKTRISFTDEELETLKFNFKGYNHEQFRMHVNDIYSFLFCSRYKTIVAPGDFGVCVQVASLLGRKVVAGDIDVAKVNFINEKAKIAGITNMLMAEDWVDTLKRAKAADLMGDGTVVVLSHLLSNLPNIAFEIAKKYKNVAIVIYDHTLSFKGMNRYNTVRPFDYSFFVRNFKGRPLFRRNSPVYGKPSAWLAALPAVVGIEDDALLSLRDHARRLKMTTQFCSYRLKAKGIAHPSEFNQVIQAYDDYVDLRYKMFFCVKTGKSHTLPRYETFTNDFVLPCVTPLQVMGEGLRSITVRSSMREETLITKAPFVVKEKGKYYYYRDNG